VGLLGDNRGELKRPCDGLFGDAGGELMRRCPELLGETGGERMRWYGVVSIVPGRFLLKDRVLASVLEALRLEQRFCNKRPTTTIALNATNAKPFKAQSFHAAFDLGGSVVVVAVVSTVFGERKPVPMCA